MSQSTVNIQRMKSVSSELDKTYATMTNNKKKLDELINSLSRVWSGEGAKAYLSAYSQNANDFTMLAEAIRGCSATLSSITNTYGKADAAAADAIKSKMAKG